MRDRKLRRWCIGLLTTIILSSGTDSQVQAQEGMVAYLPYRDFSNPVEPDIDRLWVVDLADGTVLAKIPVGVMPGGIQVNERGDRIYVLAQIGHEFSELVIVDATTLRVSDRIPLPWLAITLELDEASDKVIVTSSSSPELAVVDTGNGAISTHVLDQPRALVSRVAGSRWLMFSGFSLDSSLIWDMDSSESKYVLAESLWHSTLSEDEARLYGGHVTSGDVFEFSASDGTLLEALEPSVGFAGAKVLRNTETPRLIRVASAHRFALFDFANGQVESTGAFSDYGFFGALQWRDQFLVVGDPARIGICSPFFPCPVPPSGRLLLVDTENGAVIDEFQFPPGGVELYGHFVGPRRFPVPHDVPALHWQGILLLFFMLLIAAWSRQPWPA